MSHQFARSISVGLIGVALLAQTAPELKFEVAAIHPAPDPLTLSLVERRQRPSGIKVNGNQVNIGSLTLKALVMTAFGARAESISGPDWMGAQLFDIRATMPAGATKDQLPEMLQALLVERFHLALHHVSKEESGYALVLGKPPLKLEPASARPRFFG